MSVWAGKYCLMCTGPARYCSKQVSGILLYISGPSGPLLPSLPFLCDRPKTRCVKCMPM